MRSTNTESGLSAQEMFWIINKSSLNAKHTFE
jgi:hypothetical protein